MPKTTKQMEGIYMCTAENKTNVTNSSAYLHVFGKDRKIVYFIPGGRGGLLYDKVSGPKGNSEFYFPVTLNIEVKGKQNSPLLWGQLPVFSVLLYLQTKN